jgi:hypothetical protein
MLTDSLLNRNFDINLLRTQQSAGWKMDKLSGRRLLSNSSPAAGRLGHDRARNRGRIILMPPGVANNKYWLIRPMPGWGR